MNGPRPSAPGPRPPARGAKEQGVRNSISRGEPRALQRGAIAVRGGLSGITLSVDLPNFNMVSILFLINKFQFLLTFSDKSQVSNKIRLSTCI